jgi:hypothetical protein
MKNFTFIFVLLISSFGLMAQGQSHGVAPLAKGDMQLNFGTGFCNYGVPIYGTFDYAVHKDVTLGGTFNLNFYPKWDSFLVGIVFKGDYHWNYLLGIPSNIDFYTGPRLGFMFGTDFKIDAGIQIGGRYYWNDKWAANLEIIGSSNYGFNVGVSMKLK